MKVIAIQSFNEGVLRKFGEGEYIGDFHIPNNGFKVKNPCIRLDNGKYVWGFQSWWGDVVKFYEKYGKYVKKEIIVDDFDEIIPNLEENEE